MKYTTELRKSLKIVNEAGPKCVMLLVGKYGSLRKASESTGISYVHLCRIRNGQAEPSLGKIAEMLVALET